MFGPFGARENAPKPKSGAVQLSNLLAAVGRGQLRVLDQRVAQRRANFAFYQDALGDLPGITFMPEHPQGRATRWLTCLKR